jgi:hypothetical protein
MRYAACETAFTLFTDVNEALSRARVGLIALGFEVNAGPAAGSVLARRPSFRSAPASGVVVNARAVTATQTTLSVRAWGKSPRDACQGLARELGVRQRNGRVLQAPGPEDLRGEYGYSLADAPARARRQVFGGPVGQAAYSVSAGVIAAFIALFVFIR